MSATLPSFLLAGASYSGAEIVHELLKDNPALFFPPGKPSAFFYRNDLYKGGLEPYAALFAAAGGHRIPGDLGVQYFERGIVLNEARKYSWQPQEDSALRIKKHKADTKIILMLRQPLTRAHLQFQQAQASRIEKAPTLAAALEEELAGTRSPETHPLCYLYRNRLAEHIGHWRRLFGASNIHVVSYETLMADTAGTLQKMEVFIGVRPHSPEPLKLARLRGDIKGSMARVLEVLDIFPSLKPVRDIIAKKVHTSPKPLSPTVSPLPDSLMEKLKPILDEDKAKLEAMLGPVQNNL